MERVIKVVTGSPQPVGQGIDRVVPFGGDLQTPASVSLQIVAGSESGPAGNGSFSVSGNSIIFTPAGLFNGSLTPEQVEAGFANKRISFQYSDGINLSPPYLVRVIGFEFDSTPADALPDNFMNTYFGTTTPGAPGSPSHPASDPDGDRLNNRIERYLGTSPINAVSGPSKLTYNTATNSVTLNPVRYSPQVMEVSENLVDWNYFRLYHTVEAATPALVEFFDVDVSARKFYRVSVTP